MEGTNYRFEPTQALEAESAKLWSIIKNLRDNGIDTSHSHTIGALSSYDQHPADDGTETFEREKDIGLIIDTKEQLDQVTRAKEKLTNGTYGVCDGCGEQIDPERMQVLPSATLCVQCKEGSERASSGYHRPVEEDTRIYSLTRSWRYPLLTAYDREDTWQDLAKFGTSNGPEDVPDSIEMDDAYINADEDVGLVEEIDGIMDLGYSMVTDQTAIYPDPKNANPRRRPHQADLNFPSHDEKENVDWSTDELDNIGFPDVDHELLRDINSAFPRDPEMELAEELTPEIEAAWRQEWLDDAKKDDRIDVAHDEQP